MKEITEVYLALLLKVANEEGLEIGDSLVQKGMYLIDNALGADLDIHFEAYLHGPYSKGLNSLAGPLLRAYKKLREEDNHE